MRFIKAKKIFRYIPQKTQHLAGLSPYMIPIFGSLYFGRIKSIIKFFLQFNKNFPKVLEIGGGYGIFSANFKFNFPKSEVFLLDLYSIKIRNQVMKIMENKLNLDLNYHFQCDIQKKTHFEENSFDLVFALDVLEHIPNPNAALNEIIRLLKKGGYLFISVPIESKLIKVFRQIYNKIKPIEINPHWNGLIKSEEEFHELLINKNINIFWKQKYPGKYLPKIFSYDMFYFIKN